MKNAIKIAQHHLNWKQAVCRSYIISLILQCKQNDAALFQVYIERKGCTLTSDLAILDHFSSLTLLYAIVFVLSLMLNIVAFTLFWTPLVPRENWQFKAITD